MLTADLPVAELPLTLVCDTQTICACLSFMCESHGNTCDNSNIVDRWLTFIALAVESGTSHVTRSLCGVFSMYFVIGFACEDSVDMAAAPQLDER